MRTLSVESLRWCGPHNDEHRPSEALLRGLEKLRDHALLHVHARSREEVFYLARAMRLDMHDWLEDHFAASGTSGQDAEFLGLDPKVGSFEIHSLRVANRVSPDGDLLRQVIIEILQDKEVAVHPEDPNGEKTVVEGGCTVVADLQRLRINYCIRKNLASKGRLARQQQYVARFGSGSLHATYFGNDAALREPVASLHRSA